MKRLIAGLVFLVMAGCGVSKDLYQAEVVKSQERAARAAELETRLTAESGARQECEGRLAEREKELEARGETGRQLAARGEDLAARLDACSGRERDLAADLDLCRKDRASVRAELEAAVEARAEEARHLTQEIEALRSEIAVLQSRAAVLTEEKERADREKRERLDEISRTYEGLLQGLKGEVEKGRITISQLQGKLSVNLLDEILFDSGSAAVKPEGQEVLSKLGEILEQAADKAIVIEGHTDDVPISGELARRFPTNWELSTARATSVVRYLQERAKIQPERLSAVGFGPYRAVASNEAPEGRARNRRIEIKLVPLEAPLFAPSETSEEPAATEPDRANEP